VKAAIRRISLASLGKMGCLLGVVAAFLPSLVCGLSGLAVAHLVQRWLLSWQTTNISVLGRQIAQIDLVKLLGLQQALHFLETLTAASVPVLFLVILVLSLACGALLALIVMLVGLAYNVLAMGTGGVVVELRAVKPRNKSE
jgi:hypothetical protein